MFKSAPMRVSLHLLYISFVHSNYKKKLWTQFSNAFIFMWLHLKIWVRIGSRHPLLFVEGDISRKINFPVAPCQSMRHNNKNPLSANKGHDRIRLYLTALKNNGDVSNCMKFFQSERLIINQSTNHVCTYLYLFFMRKDNRHFFCSTIRFMFIYFMLVFLKTTEKINESQFEEGLAVSEMHKFYGNIFI